MIVPSIRKLEKIVGMSHTMLNRHLKAGKFQAEPGGGYDPEKVKAAIAANRDVSQPSQSKGAKAAKVAAHQHREAVGSEDQVEPDHEGNSTQAVFNRAKAKREVTRAAQADLDLKKRLGELVEVAEVERTWATILTSIRGALLLLPAKLAPKVSVLKDPRECEMVIDREVRLALAGLSEYQPNADA